MKESLTDKVRSSCKAVSEQSVHVQVNYDYIQPYASLLPSITLADTEVLAKSGTLTGVFTYAGYLTHKQHMDGYVLILNQQKNTRDQLLNLLIELYNRKTGVRGWPEKR